jgi:hypothetical protein
LPERTSPRTRCTTRSESADRGAQHELDERDAAGHQIEDGALARLLPQIARIHAVRLDRHECLRDELLVVRERSLGGLHAGRVTVEGEDHLAGERVRIHQQPTDHRDVFGAERGAARGDGGRHTGEMAGHNVRVALDDHSSVLAGDVLLGHIHAVQQLTLLVDRRLRRVQVLGLDAIVVEQPARTEPDDVTAGVADRPEQPPVEAIDQSPARRLAGQAGQRQLRTGETFGEQVLGEHVPSGRRVAAAECLCHGLVESALGEELAGFHRVSCVQLLGVEALRLGVRLDQPGPLPRLAARGAGSLDVADLEPGPGRETFDRLGELDVFDVLHEPDDIAADTTSEAVEETLCRRDGQRRSLLVVERADALQVAAAGRAQLDLLADDVVDGRLLTDQGDVLVPDPPHHASESRRGRRRSRCAPVPAANGCKPGRWSDGPRGDDGP